MEFDVPMEIVGLLVGSQYKNVREMEKKYEVYIKVESNQENAMSNIPICISGENKDNVKEVEKKLRIMKKIYKVPKKHIGFIIGKSGQRIKDIMERAKLLKIEFEDTNSTDDTKFLLL